MTYRIHVHKPSIYLVSVNRTRSQTSIAVSRPLATTFTPLHNSDPLSPSLLVMLHQLARMDPAAIPALEILVGSMLSHTLSHVG
jgi:hypothetical protein